MKRERSQKDKRRERAARHPVEQRIACPPFAGPCGRSETWEGFDSKIWPVAIGILAGEIGIEIPDDVNIFVSEDGETALSIDQVVAAVCKLGHRRQEGQRRPRNERDR